MVRKYRVNAKTLEKAYVDLENKQTSCTQEDIDTWRPPLEKAMFQKIKDPKAIDAVMNTIPEGELLMSLREPAVPLMG